MYSYHCSQWRVRKPRQEKYFQDFTPLMIALKYITSLTFSHSCAAGEGCKKKKKKFRYIRPFLSERKKNTTSVALWDAWVFSSRLELAVSGVLFWSGNTITTFLLAFKTPIRLSLICIYLFFVRKALHNPPSSSLFQMMNKGRSLILWKTLRSSSKRLINVLI